MKVLSCSSTRRRLQAYHDQELPVADQIAVAAHLDWCADCENEYNDITFVGDLLRIGAPGRAMAAEDNEPGFSEGLVGRLQAEDDQALGSRLREAFDDMHFVYAGVGATLATAACLVIVLGMMRFATAVRPDSLAAIIDVLASPGSNEYPVSIDPPESVFALRTMMPVALDAAISARAAAVGDAQFAMAGVVTREGLVKNLDLLDADDGGTPIVDEDQVVEDLMHAMSRTRFQPAQKKGLAVAVNIVWVVAHATVRGTEPPLEPALPVGKKKAASAGLRGPATVGG
jgi:hypothetical protein